MPSSLATSGTVAPPANLASAPRSLRTICSGVCFLPNFESPPSAHSGLLWTLIVTGSDSGGRVIQTTSSRSWNASLKRSADESLECPHQQAIAQGVQRYAQKLWIGDFVRHAVYLPEKVTQRAGALTPVGRIHRYVQSTSGQDGA